MKIRYQDLKLRPDSLKIVAQANAILSEYARRGIIVTLRQLYYQFVAHLDQDKPELGEGSRLRGEIEVTTPLRDAATSARSMRAA